ncbi:MAG: FecCD family ABC transporter permease [Planctomycetota bacterium]
MKKRLAPTTFLLIAVPATLLLATLSLLQGPKPLGLGAVLESLGAGLGLWDDVHEGQQAIVNTVRLPRMLGAIMAGACLAMAGTVMQAVFRNPLASPEVIGTTQGAAFGGVIAIATGFSAMGGNQLGSFVGAWLVTVVVFVIASGPAGFSVSSLLLAGIAMNSLMGALISFTMTLRFDNWVASVEILHWLLGSMERATPENSWILLAGLVVFGLPLAAFLRDLDLLTLKDDGAAALGVNVARLRKVLVFLACGLAATTVSVTGGIFFIGLVVPHMARLIVGPAHRGLLPCAGVLGAFVLLLADYLCRVVFPGLRVGVVTSALGAPFFLILLFRHRRGMELLGP